MFTLFIAHHILNVNWYKALFKEKYSAIRVVTLVIDTLLLVSMLAQIYSAVIMSHHVFGLLPPVNNDNMAAARFLSSAVLLIIK